MRLLLLSLAIAGALPAVPASQNTTACRCLPTEPCWPSTAEWQSLNDTVGGQLSRVSPLGAVCHDQEYDEEACGTLLAGAAYDSSVRAAAPGAGQWANWEAWEARNESCYIETPRSAPCQLGRVSPYSVAARGAGDVAAAVKFAGEHNVRLVVKNTGHDFAGRSLAPHSLQIETRHMRGIEFSEDFVVEGDEEGGGPAVTVAAGVQLVDLYRFCHERNVTVVGGFSSTVGVAGGYVQGGGHSILSPWKGLASDNVLQYTVVTADGTHLTANSCQNADLFWALRGGGGGTFGVVTSATLAAHPNPPLTHFSLEIARPDADPPFWDLVETLYAHLPGLNDLGASLSSVAYPQSVIPSPADGTPTTGRALLTLKGFVVGGVTEDFRTALDELEDDWRSGQNGTLTAPADFHFNVTTLPSVTTAYTHVLTGSDPAGALTAVGSRLISRDFVASPQGPRAVADVMAGLGLAPGEAVSGNVVSGGAVAASEVDSAVHPAWRRALVHVMVVRGWLAGDDAAGRAVREEVTRVQVPALKKLVLPGEEMGAYLNEADAYEPGFQEAFWGSNYRRLREVKEKWDPTGMFVVRSGVGSEEWDEEGMCRRR